MADTFLNNLPLQLTSFIGRERETAEVKQLLTSSRVVTLTGAGGCGKTRLALRVASDLRDDYADGVCWAELAPLADATLLPQAIAQALNTMEQPGRALLDVILDMLRTKRLLLVLDNCEHLASTCAEFAHDALCDAPQINILATSREPLAVTGEMLYPVAPLALPPKSQVTDIASFDSIRLFVERAHDVLPNFTLTSANALPVADICRRLDGIPLAIELASARVNALTVEQIAARLDDRFALLTSARHGVPSHHRTLRAALDWSYSSLSAQEQTLLRRLSVFADGFTLDAVEQVCAGDGIAPEEIVDGLSSLVNKSLVVAETLKPGEARYRMLETIRQYARDKLGDSGEGAAIRNRHLDYFLKFARLAEHKFHGPEEVEWLERLDLEHDNIRAALDWSLGEGRVEKGLQLVGALLWFWGIRGYLHEGRERAEKLLTQPQATAKNLARANGLLVAGVLTTRWYLADSSASHRNFEELVAIARGHGESGKRFLALGLGYLSEWTFGDNPDFAESMIEEGLALARSSGEQWLVAHLFWFKAYHSRGRRDYSASRKWSEESLKICQSIGDKREAARSLQEIAMANEGQNDCATAHRYLEQSLLICREMRDRRNIAVTLVLLGEVERADNKYDDAKNHHLECLELVRELGAQKIVTLELNNLGSISLHDRDIRSAKLLFGEGLALAREMSDRQQILFSLVGVAEVMAVEKNARQAVSLFAFFQTSMGPDEVRDWGPADEADYARYLSMARDQLDEATFNAAWEEGKAMTIEQAIALAEREIVTLPPAPAPDLPRDPNALTPREIEVLRLVAAGLSDVQVASKLVISRRTVNAHLTAIYGKLGVNSRSAATRCALDRKLV